MSFINVSLGQAQEKEVLPEDKYDLIIESAEFNNEKKPCVVVRCSVDGHPEAQPVWHRIFLPDDGDDAQKVNNKLLMAKAFCEAFSIPYEDSGFNTEDFIGADGNVYLEQDEYEGRVSNKIRLNW